MSRPRLAGLLTHRAIDPTLSGAPCALRPGFAAVELTTTGTMRADAHGLVHGGFVFSLADHAAMLAINQPTVVLGSAEVRFLAPVRCGETLRAEARAGAAEGSKHPVEVTVHCGERVVFRGSFVCFVPQRHVLAGG